MKSIKKIALVVFLLTSFFKVKSQLTTKGWTQIGALDNNMLVTGLKTFGSDLYAELRGPGDTTSLVGKWNGYYWDYSTKVKSMSLSMAVLDDTVFAAYVEYFTKTLKVHKLVSGKWVDVPVPLINAAASDARLTVVNGELYLHGTIKTTINADIGVIKYKNGIWSNIGPAGNPGITGSVYYVCSNGGEILFNNANTLKANSSGLQSRTLLWNGSWHKFNNALDSFEILGSDLDTLFYVTFPDTTGKCKLFRHFNNVITNISYNLQLTFCWKSTFLAIKGVYYLYGYTGLGNQGICILKDKVWYPVANSGWRTTPANYFGKFHSCSYYGGQVEKINDKLAFIKGNVFKDIDGNCLNYGNDVMLKNTRKITIMPDNFTTTIDNNGDYFAAVDPGVKTISESRFSGSKYLIPASCSSKIKSTTAYYDSVVIVNFPLRDSTDVSDVNLKLFTQGGNRIRMDFVEFAKIHVTNIATKTLTGDVSLKLDAKVKLISVSPAYTSYSDRVITWSYSNLQADSTIQFEVKVKVEGGSLGEYINYSAWSKVEKDIDTTDNSDSVKCKIVGSYDPNDKQCFPADVILPNTTTLDYLVRFQNTGTSEAINVHVIDTIDTKLPIEKVVITGWSTATRPLVEVKNNNTLVFTFANIMLPDSHANEPLSHGYISYRFVLTKVMPIGTVIKNRADIIFDYNKPVKTNTTENVCMNGLGISTEVDPDNSILVYPNPAKDKIIIELKTGKVELDKANIKLYDMNGALVLSENSTNVDSQKELDVHKLNDGIYILCVYGDAGLISSQKIAIIR